ncbi:MFS transporter, partial [bacterium]|nr:MFS transporter [bacterium]
GFFLIFLLVAFGAAMFKPAITGTIARTTTKETSSFGWGIFYMVVNIGGFAGPLVAGILRGWDWSWIFAASAGWIVINLVLVTLFYKEPPKDVEVEAKKRSLGEILNGMVEVLGNGRLFFATFVVIILLLVMTKGWMTGSTAMLAIGGWILFNLLIDIPLKRCSKVHAHDAFDSHAWYKKPMRLGNWRFVLFLIILSGFWVVYNQVFMTVPEYLRDFVDTTPILEGLRVVFTYVGLTGLAAKMAAAIETNYQINPEFIINVNPLSIIVFQLVVTWLFLKRKPFFTMITGIIVTGLGMVLLAIGALKIIGTVGDVEIGAVLIANGWIVVLGIVIFTVGEMLTSPKSQEYIALIAPKDKVAIYMGYYFVAVALGNLFGGLLSGGMYGWLARDLRRPDLMWMFFAVFSIAVMFIFMIYNKLVVQKAHLQEDLPTHDSHMIHAVDGEDVPEIPEME